MIQHSFTFVDELWTEDDHLYIANLDVSALFTNMSLDETIEIYVKKLFCDLVYLTTKELFFAFNKKFYIQVDGAAMGIPEGPIMANIFP